MTMRVGRIARSAAGTSCRCCVARVGAGRSVRRMGARARRGQHRQHRAGRLGRHPDERRVAAAVVGVGRVDPDAARVAVPSARQRLHLARAVAAEDLEGSRSGVARDDGLAPRVAALGGPPDLHGRPAASVAERRAHLGGLLDRRMDRRHAARPRDAPQRGVPAAQRRLAQRQDRGHAVPDSPRQLPHVPRHRLRPGVSDRAAHSQHRVPARRQPADSAVSVHGGHRSGSAEGRRAALPARHEQGRRLVLAPLQHPDGRGDGRRREHVSRDPLEDSALDGRLRARAAAGAGNPAQSPASRRRAPGSSSRARADETNVQSALVGRAGASPSRRRCPHRRRCPPSRRPASCGRR